ncbi:MAG: hypothetical protein WBQ49_06675 [Rhodomicrobium sp.]
MIQAVLLIALGFLTASLIGVLVAPAFWNRASRLTRKRLEQTLPVTLSEIEATQDQLRASYAVRMRRLETALAGAKQKAAMQLVDNSRLQMQIAALKDQIADLDLQLSERRNAATVLEQTITKRFPELDREITTVKVQLQERAYGIQDLSNKLSRRNEDLEAAQRAATSYREELLRVQEALEKNSAGRGGRRLKRASQWNLDDYRAEYDRLNLELSRLRQQLSQLQERDAQQASVIKEDLQKLAELILVSAQPKAGDRTVELIEPIAKRASGLEVRRGRPLPWPESISPVPAPAPSPALEESEKNTESELQAPAAIAPLAATFGAPPDAGQKSRPTSEPQEGAGSAQADVQPPRSSLLREAVPGKPAQGNGVSARSVQLEAGAPSAGSESRPPERENAAPESVNGSGFGLEEIKSENQGGLPGDAEILGPSANERNGAAPGRTLLERLRGTAEETVESGN